MQVVVPTTTTTKYSWLLFSMILPRCVDGESKWKMQKKRKITERLRKIFPENLFKREKRNENDDDDDDDGIKIPPHTELHIKKIV